MRRVMVIEDNEQLNATEIEHILEFANEVGPLTVDIADDGQSVSLVATVPNG